MVKLPEYVEKELKKQTQDGLADVFNRLSCKAVAREIKENKKVTENVEFGIRYCVHNKLGPTVNVETMKFNPMSAKNKELENRFVGTVNKLLVDGGFRKVSSKLIPSLRKADKDFEKKIKNRRR